jgi:hypothetical protein
MNFNEHGPSSPSDSVDGEYAALLQDEDSATKEIDVAIPTPQSTFRLVRIATCIIVLCTVIDMLLLLYLGVQQHSAHRPVGRDEQEDLEIRSPYVNLAELYSQTSLKSSKHDPLVNHARAFIQISSTEPHKIFPPYGLMRPIADGMVPEYQRHLVVTPTISTIAQFRVADFGMENCSLSITVPPRADSKDHIHDEPATLDIWVYPVTKKAGYAEIILRHATYRWNILRVFACFLRRNSPPTWLPMPFWFVPDF